jgi:hypothetical protein
VERARARAPVAVHDDALPATDRVRVATSA